jgi:RNA polymerase sigma-70 factor (ECF subfamily)
VQQAVGDVGELVARARQYDQAAFAALYHLAVRPVYRYLSARLRDVSEAEELTQEVFLAALHGIHALRATDEASVLAWLFQIARHKLADHLRRRYRRPTAPLEAAGQMAAAEPQPDDALEARDEREALRQALDQLTPEQREVVICKYVLGYSNERTASHVGRNANAVNQLHHRALASLRRLLARTEGVT